MFRPNSRRSFISSHSNKFKFGLYTVIPTLFLVVLFGICVYGIYQYGKNEGLSLSTEKLENYEHLLKLEKSKAQKQAKEIKKEGRDFGSALDSGKVKTLSWSPRAQLWSGFLTEEECDYIIARGKDRLTRSLVVGAKGKDTQSDHRTSTGVFLTYMIDDPVIKKIEERMSDWTHLPVENQEHFYLLRYEPGQQYKAHHDYFSDPKLLKYGGNRIATIVTYLDAPGEGGATAFPSVGLKVEVKKGDALLFWDYTPDLQPDPNSMHASQPVKTGTKFAMAKWIRMRKFR